MSLRQDPYAPVLSVRNGTWRFHIGDDASWATPSFNDTAWPTVIVPHDWRLPPTSYTATNALGWYRRAFDVSPMQMAAATAGTLVFSLGTVAAGDETYINGQRVGGVGHMSGSPDCTDALQFRRYTVPTGLLKAAGNIVAVRVYSQGGDPATPDTSRPGGLCDTGQPEGRFGPFDAGASPGQKSTGYTVGGVGWYRKTFTVASPLAAEDVVASIRFDGVYMNSAVWLNGRLVGQHPYGYTTFSHDLTPYIRLGAGASNVLAVRVANTGRNSRWFSGSGIYRHVWLVVVPKVRLDLWGLFVHTPAVDVGAQTATVVVEAAIANARAVLAHATISVLLHDPAGAEVGHSATSTAVAPQSVANTSQTLRLAGVRLWSPSSPHLYTATVQISSGTSMDTINTTFGVRTFSFTASQGLVLSL